MYYSARWEIRQMIFRTSSLCLYTNSSTSSTATEKKRMFRSSRFKSPLEKITKKKLPTKTRKRLVVTCNVWPCAAVCGHWEHGCSRHTRTRRVRTRERKKRKSHIHVQSGGSRLKTVLSLKFGWNWSLCPPQPNNALRKSSSSLLLYKWH